VSAAGIYVGNARLVDGDPLQDVAILQDAAQLRLVMQGPAVHKNLLEAAVLPIHQAVA
jgi:hypothetical protein